MKKKLLIAAIAVIQLGILAGVLLNIGRRPFVDIKYTEEDMTVIWDGSEEQGFYLDKNGARIATPEIILPNGIYRISGEYMLQGSGRLFWECVEPDNFNSIASIVSGTVNLDVKANHFSELIHINEDEKPFRIYCRLTEDMASGDYFLLYNIQLETSPVTVRYYGFLGVLIFIAIDILLYFIYKRKEIAHWFNTLPEERRLVSGGLLITIALISLPAMVSYVTNGHDLPFHLARIEGIKDGLISGQFPVRIQPEWMNGHGYASGIMYGDLLMYFPAILRWFGLSLTLAYNIYVIAINVATVLIAYYCFRKISGKPYIALMATVFYSANMYRLVNIYIRAAAGEYTAMIFFPLIVYGLWKLFAQADGRDDDNNTWKILAVGYSGIIVSHVISFMLAAGYTLLICLIMWKKLFNRRTVITLLKTVTTVVLLNLWFLLPFIDYMRYNWIGTQYDLLVTPYRLSYRAEFIPQFFMTDYGLLNGSTNYTGGINGEMPYTPGVSFIIILAGGALLKGRKDNRNKRLEVLLYSLIGITVFATSTLFPWFLVCKINLVSIAARVLQFPWRLNAVTIALAALLACLIAAKLELSRLKYYGFMALVIFITCLQGLDLESRVLNEKTAMRIETLGSGKFNQSGGEYLPAGAKVEDYVAEITLVAEDVEITQWDQDYNSVAVTVTNHGEETAFEVPLLNYKGYQATDMNGTTLPLLTETSLCFA